MAIADAIVPEKVEVTGQIVTASFDVFINSKTRGAARASPDSYVPLARLDASGDKTEKGGLGTTEDAKPE